jgi:transposase
MILLVLENQPNRARAQQSLNEWAKKAETDSGVRRGVPSEIAERLKALERENRELRQANEILRKASAYFAQAELDRRFKS